MSIKLVQNADICDESVAKNTFHAIYIMTESYNESVSFHQHLVAKLKRANKTLEDLKKSPIVMDMPNGIMISLVVIENSLTTFERHTLIRKAAKPILEENPENIGICLYGDEKAKEINACAAYYVIAANAEKTTSRKKQENTRRLNTIYIYGHQGSHGFTNTRAKIAGNILCRTLTTTPPNDLTPGIYRKKIYDLAKENGWTHEEFDMQTLTAMGAGAFTAVGQGSSPQDAAIVHLTYQPVIAKKHMAVVGKGICFDTGGHNLKPAKYMLGMHEDMNGSAVALGILLAATQMQLPVKMECWLAIAQNHISPTAYKQNDVVKALNGMTIEIVHTDAEGRMVLADALTLASRQKPELIIDFATLTGSMITALGDRMSGVISNKPELACKAIAAGYKAGERVVAFPYAEDYDSDLDSDVADIKQCTLEGGGDHLHAARFLGKFIENNIPWLHTDLSSASRRGGLGAIEADTNGFGVGFGLELIQMLLDEA